MIHITNGDSAVAMLRQAGFADQMLPWRDVLHEGPVRAGLSLDQLSRERAAFIAEAGWGFLPSVQRDFETRDAILRAAHKDDGVVLWFEHDLYDQLQLIQLLDWFAAHPHPRLALVCEAEYLGTMVPSRALELFRSRQPVTDAHLKEGRDAWAAFTGSDPARIRTEESANLPFLGAALRRQLEEYPWASDGLSRLERAVVEALHEGPLEFSRLFFKTREEPAFLGDAILEWHLERMTKERLLTRKGNYWMLSGEPRSRRLPRWLGGVRVDANSPWRWDPASARIVRLS